MALSVIEPRNSSGQYPIEYWKSLVQLGGLEPPTSCSTDRRSNQLSYNCILASRASGRPSEGRCRGGWTGRKLGATGVFGKAAKPDICPSLLRENVWIGGASFTSPRREEVGSLGARMWGGARSNARADPLTRIAPDDASHRRGAIRPLPLGDGAPGAVECTISKRKPGRFGPGFHCLA